MARKKKGAPPHDEISEAWLLPYSDLMTLLLALFICLFAISQTDEEKFTQMAQAFSSAFNMGGPSFFEGAGPAQNSSRDMFSNEDGGMEAYLAENRQMEVVKRQMDTYIEQNDLGDEVSTMMTEDGLMIRIKENALFPSGSAELTEGVQRIGPVIAALVAPIPQRILVTGHTDNVPITSSLYPSNWELSSARAINFMKYILAQDGRVNPARFSAMGRSEYRPIADNATEDGRAQNRRVEVLIERSVHVDKSEYQTAR